jgi:hypothetical protein
MLDMVLPYCMKQMIQRGLTPESRLDRDDIEGTIRGSCERHEAAELALGKFIAGAPGCDDALALLETHCQYRKPPHVDMEVFVKVTTVFQEL